MTKKVDHALVGAQEIWATQTEGKGHKTEREQGVVFGKLGGKYDQNILYEISKELIKIIVLKNDYQGTRLLVLSCNIAGNLQTVLLRNSNLDDFT